MKVYFDKAWGTLAYEDNKGRMYIPEACNTARHWFVCVVTSSNKRRFTYLGKIK